MSQTVYIGKIVELACFSARIVFEGKEGILYVSRFPGEHNPTRNLKNLYQIGDEIEVIIKQENKDFIILDYVESLKED